MLIQAFKGGGWGVGIMGVVLILVGIFIMANTFSGHDRLPSGSLALYW